MSQADGARARENCVMKFLKRVLGLGMLAAAAYALWRAFERRRVGAEVGWEPRPFPYPPQPRAEPPHDAVPAPESDGNADGDADADAPTSNGSAWVEPDGGACPATHPVKAKLASGIFHVPGGANYDRTNADRCYLSVEAAESDGLRPSKR
jgi:hypothetical protein